ncbi:chorismate-binding protein [Cyclobacterium qasimii]|uniref:Para-aminobenzoate synthase, aminase component n=2 Tax=Cyclobacterium qasimii TaxID=1350429 RepID=S7VM19_9BACT|nr:anthranilate synthase component I family protein [Cyclobacterium qasimii]EPR70497.1 Para-aminobenzoate synthase, aminase component [Cyclobacterium qasimii M12-11B]GEO22312.1 para-aminobenzoate synthase [Cyclobacterium qasimii]
MSATESKLTVNKTSDWIPKMLEWANLNFAYFGYFTSHDIDYPSGGFEHVFYAGSQAVSLENINQLPNNKPKIGIVSYDQKNKYEKLTSNNNEIINCPDSLFFSPDLTISFNQEELTIQSSAPNDCYKQILNTKLPDDVNHGNCSLHSSHDEESYRITFNSIQDHILAGDIYELNYCMDFHGEVSNIEPIRIFLDLCENSPMPFSALFKAVDLYLCCASPERFLKKKGRKLLTQPIKGTIKRGRNIQEDEALKRHLAESEKERAENLMIVDLMRNDLARMALTGTIKVEELFGIYSFRQITQMISTISCQLPLSENFEHIIPKTFPMGSMTGAPKIKCMELIEAYENFKRAWFSGSIGYIDEQGDFDFCVIIRSLIMDQTKKSFYFGVGSAITIDADAKNEYEECLLKASSIIKTLKNTYTIINNPN